LSTGWWGAEQGLPSLPGNKHRRLTVEGVLSLAEERERR
jgi:hypothetical protein